MTDEDLRQVYEFCFEQLIVGIPNQSATPAASISSLLIPTASASANSLWVSLLTEITSEPIVPGTLSAIHLCKKLVPRVLISP